MTITRFSYLHAAGAFLSIALATLYLPSPANAGTIIKLSLGSETAADISYDGTTLQTISDGGPGVGDQQTDIGYLGILSGETDVILPVASYTMSGLTKLGATVPLGGGVFLQNFNNGSMSLFDPLDNLLLSGNLNSSVLTGATSTGSGGFFTVTFGSFTGGTLAPQLDPNSLTLSMTIEDANFTLPGGELAAFSANAQVTIGADPVPEPASLALVLLGSIAAVAFFRHGRK